MNDAPESLNEQFSYSDPGTVKVQPVLGVGSGDPIPTIDRSTLFRELGTTGLTRFGGLVYEEFLRELQGPNGIALLREMRENHPIVSAVFFAIEMALRQVRWHMEPPKSKDMELTDFLESCREDMSYTWNDIVAQILTMLQYGFSPFELVYKVRRGMDGDPESNFNDGKIGWRKWIPIAQDTLAPGRNWIFDPWGGIQGLHQMAPPDWQLRTIPIEKLLLFRTTVAKNNPEGRSIMRGMYTSWYFSKNLQEIEGIAAERMGTGLPVVYMGEDTTKSGTQSDLVFAQQITRDTRADEQMGVVIPYPKMGQGAAEGKGMLFELVSPPSRGMIDFSQVIDRYDKRIAMAVLAQFLMLGLSEHGSFALAKSHSDLFALAMESWGEMIAAVVNRYAIPRLLRANRMKFQGDDIPKLVHSEVEVANLTEIADYVNKLVAAQVLTPDSNLEAALREKARLPKKQEEIDLGVQSDIAVDSTDPQANPVEKKPKPLVGNPNPIPFPENKFSEKFQAPLERRAYGGAKYETANNDYQNTLQTIYKEFWMAIVGALLAADSYEQRQGILEAGLTELKTDLLKAGRKGLREGFDLGLSGEEATPAGLEQLRKRVQANEDFISNNLIPAIKTKAEAALADEELLLGGEEALGGTFQTLNGRLGMYAGAHWTSIWDGMGDGLSQVAGGLQRRVQRVLDPAADHCDDCIEFAHIYDNWEQMVLVAGIPGDGNTQCYSNCRCIIKVETAPGSGVFERLSVAQNVERFEEEGQWVTLNGSHFLICQYKGAGIADSIKVPGSADAVPNDYLISPEGTLLRVIDSHDEVARLNGFEDKNDLITHGWVRIDAGKNSFGADLMKGNSNSMADLITHIQKGEDSKSYAISIYPEARTGSRPVNIYGSSKSDIVAKLKQEWQFYHVRSSSEHMAARYPVDPRIWEAESLIANSTVEQQYGLSSTGEAVTFPRGSGLTEHDKIVLTESEQEALKDGIYTHNHPGDKSYAELSAGDYELARQLDLQMIRVIGTNGKVAIAIRPPGGWVPTWGDFLADERYTQYHFIEQSEVTAKV